MLSVGTAGVDCAFFAVGRPERVTDLEGSLEPSEGRVDPDEPGRDSDASGMSGSGFLVFDMGNAGNGPDGGLSGGREGRWTVLVIVIDIALKC